VRRVLTTRAGGRSTAPYASFNLSYGVGDDRAAVAANRSRLNRELGLAPDAVVWMQQVHGNRVATVDGPTTTELPRADAVVTARPGLAVAVLAADCVPVLLADPAAGVVGAVHAGRVGAAAGVLPAAVDAMTRLGARPDATEVLLGPAICGLCYEVPADLQAQVEDRLPGSACTTTTGSAGLDLRAGLELQLVALGVPLVGVDPRCTFEDQQLYSHRRQRPTGRFATVTWLDYAE
jgi:polyphenol oxidase